MNSAYDFFLLYFALFVMLQLIFQGNLLSKEHGNTLMNTTQFDLKKRLNKNSSCLFFLLQRFVLMQLMAGTNKEVHDRMSDVETNPYLNSASVYFC